MFLAWSFGIAGPANQLANILPTSGQIFMLLLFITWFYWRCKRGQSD
jgi:hypothetical protein